MKSRWLAVLSALAAAVAGSAATRPHYGGTLRVEIRESMDTADPPETGSGMANLNGDFSISRWEGGRAAAYSANEDAVAGRPFLDNIEIQMARPWRDEAIDLELGKADLVSLGPNETRRSAGIRKTWSTAPVRLLVLTFSARVTDPRLREALALAIDRGAIHNVLLQRQGEITAALLPQWISGYAFLFPTVSDTSRARNVAAALPPPSRTLSLGVSDPIWRPIAERISVNARDAGLTISVTSQAANADVRLMELRITDSQPAHALSELAAALGLGQAASADTPQDLYTAERMLLDGYRVIPLFHLPEVYGVGPRVKGLPGISPMGNWRFGDLWLEGPRP
jgi:hypothetical protein